MKTKEISVSVSRKINLGNYESCDLFAGFTGTIEDGDDLTTAYCEAWKIVKDEVKEQYRSKKAKK